MSKELSILERVNYKTNQEKIYYLIIENFNCKSNIMEEDT